MGLKKTVQVGLLNFSQPEGLLKGEPEGWKLTRNSDSKKTKKRKFQAFKNSFGVSGE